MSLKGFHLFFVGLTSLGCMALAAWAVQQQLDFRFCLLFFLSGAASGAYGIGFLRKIKKCNL